MAETVHPVPDAAFDADALPTVHDPERGVPLSAAEWEALVAGGGGPCLALGAERRLRRIQKAAPGSKTTELSRKGAKATVCGN